MLVCFLKIMLLYLTSVQNFTVLNKTRHKQINHSVKQKVQQWQQH